VDETPRVDANTTLYAALQNVIRRCPDRDALVLGKARITYGELGRRVDALATGLSQLGIRKGNTVGLILPVCLESLYAFFALAKLGAPFVPISPQLRSFEVRHILNDSEAVAVITEGQSMGFSFISMIQTLRAELPQLQHVIVRGQGANGETASLADLVRFEPAHVNGEPVGPDDLVALLYTSGTTGLPKGVMHTHRSYLNQMAAVFEILRPQDLLALLNHFPMFHSSGIAAPLIFLLSGGKLVLAERFNPRDALRLIEEESVSFAMGAPVTAMLMLKTAAAEPHNLSSLHVFGMGGSLCPPEVIRSLRDQLNCGVFNGLGITEAGFISTTRPDDPEDVQVHTVGRPARGVEVKIVDDQRREVPVGQSGEIVCRSPMMMRGYYKRAQETADVLDAEGWYYTGDVGSLDQGGYLRIFDRKRDMIVRGGENIYPAEIERYLATHPKIKMAAVIGVPSRAGGERVRAYILPHEGVELTPVEVMNHCRGQIATYKLPDEVRIVQEFPLSALWKVQKFRLREEALRELDTARPSGQPG
jgi:fatty-acyl-CoA synthase